VIVAPAFIAAVLLIAKPVDPQVPVAPVVPPDGLDKRKGTFSYYLSHPIFN